MNLNKEDAISKLEYYNNLYDYYGDLLTEKQQEYFRDFYFDDLSLTEIAKNNKISRSAVFDALNKVHLLLDEYELKLSLYKKYQEREKIYEKLEKKDETIAKLINELRDID